MKHQNYNLLLVKMTKTMTDWIEQMAKDNTVELPHVSADTGLYMALSAMTVLQGIDDIYNQLDIDGVIK